MKALPCLRYSFFISILRHVAGSRPLLTLCWTSAKSAFDDQKNVPTVSKPMRDISQNLLLVLHFGEQRKR